MNLLKNNAIVKEDKNAVKLALVFLSKILNVVYDQLYYELVFENQKGLKTLNADLYP